MEAGETAAQANSNNNERTQGQKPRRRQVTTACVRCRKRKIRCNGRFPCETCLRLRLFCQEPEVKRNPSRASLERRIEQLEALASGAGLDLLATNTGPPNESTISAEQSLATGRNRSHSSASVQSNLSLPLKLETSPGSLAPRSNSNNNDYDYPNTANLSPFSSSHIPTIEVTASSRSQSPDLRGFGFMGFPTPGTHSPASATTPALSTGSLSVPASPALTHPLMEPWQQFTHDYDLHARATSPFSLDQDGFNHSRRSSSSNSNAWNIPANNLMAGGAFKEEPGVFAQNQMNKSQNPTISIQTRPAKSADYAGDAMGGDLGSELAQQIEHLGGLAFSPVEDSKSFSYPLEQPGSTIAFSENDTHLLTHTYFQYVHPLFPFLDQECHFGYLTLSNSGQLSAASPIDISYTKASFQVYMVQAIGARLLEHRNGVPSNLRETYFSAATMSHSSFSRLETTHDIECALLILIYAFLSEPPGIDVCLLKSTVMASCVRLGFHRPASKIPVTLQTYRRMLTFSSAYVLDRAISIAHNTPFSLSDCDLEIELLASQLQASSLRSDHSYVDIATITTMVKVHRLITTIHTVQKFSIPSFLRLATPFLTEPSPLALSNWRSDIFRTLEVLLNHFRHDKETSTSTPAAGAIAPEPDSDKVIMDVVELKIHEATLLLLHPSRQAFELDPYEKSAAMSTARSAIAAYQRLETNKVLAPSASTARSIYTCGEVLSLLVSAEGRSADPDIQACHSLLESFLEVDIAKHLERNLAELRYLKPAPS